MEIMENKANRLILIVDDNPHNIQVLAAVITECGYYTGFAMSGKEALAFLEVNKPTLILLDIMMPEIDGYETCSKIKSNPLWRDIPIIFLTAKNEKDDIVKGFEAGGVDYITKPFNEAELKMRINTHIELKQTRDKLISVNKELQKTIASKNKFLSIIANDLRNPFNGIIGFTDYVLHDIETLEKNKIKNITERINLSSKKNYKLLDKLYEWAQIQLGNFKFNPVSINLDSLINEIISVEKDEFNKKKINPTSLIDKNTYVFADYYMVYTILLNIISNAIKFTSTDGFVKISSKTINNSNNQSMIIISVIDNGIGIKEENKNKLFRIDEKICTSGTENESGSGLGLIICKEFIEKNKGKIWIESNQNTGTKVSFSLPFENYFYEPDFDLNSLDSESIENNEFETDGKKLQMKYLLPSNLWQKIIVSLTRLLENEKIYMDPNLNLVDVAKQLNTNRVYLSQIINETFNCNFNHLINEYRIKEFIQLSNENKLKTITIEALASMVGFQNKATFNLAFKKFMGTTPSEYLKKYVL